MDLFVLASHREGFPRAAMEASAMGIPVIASAIRGCRQVVDDGVTGRLVRPRDAGLLAATVLDRPPTRSSGRDGAAADRGRWRVRPAAPDRNHTGADAELLDRGRQPDESVVGPVDETSAGGRGAAGRHQHGRRGAEAFATELVYAAGGCRWLVDTAALRPDRIGDARPRSPAVGA